MLSRLWAKPARGGADGVTAMPRDENEDPGTRVAVVVVVPMNADDRLDVRHIKVKKKNLSCIVWFFKVSRTELHGKNITQAMEKKGDSRCFIYDDVEDPTGRLSLRQAWYKSGFETGSRAIIETIRPVVVEIKVTLKIGSAEKQKKDHHLTRTTINRPAAKQHRSDSLEMGHGRKKDQGSHHRRNSHKSAAGNKPSDDPFYDLQVVDEHLVWITWEELATVASILVFVLIAYLCLYYEDVGASFSALERTARTRQSRKAATAAKFPDNSKRTTIPEQTLLQDMMSSGDDFLQLVEEPTLKKTSDSEGEGCARPDKRGVAEKPPNTSFDAFTDIRPHLCGDGKTYGYETFKELEEIIEEINAYSHGRYVEWDSFYERASDTFDGTFDDPALYFDEEIVVRICPKTTLRRRKGHALYINAENVLIECEDCIMEIKSGTHMIFGPYAQEVTVRGIHFKGATETSVRFPYDGAEVYFEDCYFSSNISRGKHIGTVADVNSTSSVDFMRCLMEKDTSNSMASSSLSIRTKEEEA
eukprot:scaffold20863_cov181-Amphora_coffeaeformis.AAC.1